MAKKVKEAVFGHWRSSLAGLVAAFFGFVVFSPETFREWPWLIAVAKYVAAGGLAAIGIAARDAARRE